MGSKIHYALFIVYLSLSIDIARAVWDDPPFSEPDPKDEAIRAFQYEDDIKRIRIVLEEGVKHKVCIAVLNYRGNSCPSIGLPSTGDLNLLGGVIERNETTNLCELWINNEQDYETEIMQQYRFLIFVESYTYEVLLLVQNIDDNPPIIRASNQCNIEENFRGESTCAYKVSDADGWTNTITFDLTSAPEGNNFKFIVSPGTVGEYELRAFLNVTEPLDFETISMYMLLVQATDGGGNKGSLETVVQVIDMPDQPPVWTRITAAKNILEKSNNTIEVAAMDGDIQINAKINYEIRVKNAEDEKYFVVDGTTGLITIHEIDRDERQQEVFEFLIIAYEKATPEWRINQTIVVLVEDTNDHVPKITPDSLEIEIDEGTYTTLKFSRSIEIEDPDLAENGQFSVALLDDSKYKWSSAFLIVPTSGYQSAIFTISVANASLLDYEDENWRDITIQLRATEAKNSSHIDTRNIRVKLKNLNDELPIFDEKTPSNVSVPEDVGEFYHIATAHATDRDVGDNVTHSLVAQRTLKIDERTGEIVTDQVDALDYESMRVVIVQIVATDQARHKTYATLTINVQDVNDDPPTLQMPKSSPRLVEEIEKSVNVSISATDVDSDAELVFSIDWANTRAQKRSTDVALSLYKESLRVSTEWPDNERNKRYAVAKINVVGRIDYEAFDVMFLTISVTDIKTKHNRNTTSATLTLYIDDINDNFPIFDEPIEAMNVPENAAKDVRIGSVTAKDADGPSNSDVSYSIKPINNTGEDLVAIDSVTGVIRVGSDKSIDAEKYEYLYYDVTATDGLNSNATAIRIYVNDLNDNQPYLDKSKPFNTTVRIDEKSPTGRIVFKVYGKDDDRTSPFNNVSYLMNGNYGGQGQYFSIGKFNGVIEVNLTDGSRLDRDFGQSEFTLNLKLRDNYIDDFVTSNINTFDTSMTIILNDINDQKPILPDLGDVAANVTEITKKGELVLRVKANDTDQPNTINTQVSYEIKCILPIDDENVIPDGKCTNLFYLNPGDDNDAQIFANADLKGYYGRWRITLYAQDKGVNPGPQNHTRYYTVQVTDYNYNPPKINYPTGKIIPLREEQTVDAQLITYDNRTLSDFNATDEDYGDSGIVTFSITSTAGEHENFKLIPIDKNVARLHLARRINVEEKDTYRLTLIAEDRGNPTLTGTQEFTVMFVTNSGPKFEENEWLVWIPENQIGPNTSKIIPAAKDSLGLGGENILDIYHFLMPDDKDAKFFALDKNNRTLTVTDKLDRENQAEMAIRVVATANQNGPPENPAPKAILTITVIVLDDNDNPPIFERNEYRAGVAMGDAIDKTILTVKATDVDLNDTLKYSIIANSMETSHSSLSETRDPFSVEPSYGDLSLKFTITSNMEGYFTFDISAHDKVGHNSTTSIWVYVVQQSSRVEFRFNNLASDVKKNRLFIMDSFSAAFGYSCNIDDIKSTTGSDGQILGNSTTVTTHFISPMDNLPIEADAIVLMSSDFTIISSLKAVLLTERLYLTDVPTGSSTSTNDIQQTVQWVLGSMALIFFFCSITLLTAFIIRTRRLNERLDKLAITKYGSQESGLDRAGVVPTTNQFALAGSNPMWKTPEKSFVDDISQGSGDSDLIGIEDNPDFGYVNSAVITDKDEKNDGGGITNPVFAKPEVVHGRLF